MQIVVGFGLGALVAVLAYRAGALDRSGALAATLVGGAIFGLGGLAWAVLLLVFFISSSLFSSSRLLSPALKRRKSSSGEKFAKGARRDYGQVLANGGLGALLAAVQAFYPDQDWPWIAYTGALAAATADTWATEIGVLSPSSPVSITSGRRVEMGTSGGVTFTGYLAALAGALSIGLAAFFASRSLPIGLSVLLAGGGGLVGASFDSLLGATLQGNYYCPRCQKETESHPLHRCGTPTERTRGWRWLNNDWVNFLCSLAGAGAALTVRALIP
jgi:uncharacterized protein (TIGR00297 family)